MNKLTKKLLVVFAFFSFFFFLPIQSYAAVSYNLVGPSGEIQRGQTISFTVNINTEGQTLTSTQIGMSFDTQYLQLQGITPGDTFSVITSTTPENGRFVITGTKTPGFSGSGVFAVVNYTLIAASSGSTEICMLFNPDTPVPTTPVTTAAPTPTAIPNTGGAVPFKIISVLGTIMLLATGGSIFYQKAVKRKT